MRIKSTLLFAAFASVGLSASAGAGFTSIDQLCGEYSLCCVQLDEGGFSEHYSTVMVPGEGENEVVFKKFYYIEGYDVPATVDLEAGTVTFHKLTNFKYIDNYEGMSDFLLFKWNTTHTRANQVNEITGTILQDGMGTIVFDPDYYFSIVVPDGVKPGPGGPSDRGYQVVCELGSGDASAMYYQPAKHKFNYFADQWQYAGQAEFTGMWIAPLAGFNNGKNTLTYKVDYYENKQNPAKILLMNPYGAGTPWTDPDSIGEDYLNTSKEQGFYFIDTTDPDFVLVASDVNSGYSSAAVPSIMCANEEGLYTYSDGYDRGTVKMVLNMYNVYEYSVRKGNDITVRNLYYYDGKNHYLSERPETYITTITLLPGAESGVKEIGIENNDAPRYYNLQGVEVMNPSKGQILIQRSSQGSRKVLVK